MAFPASMISTDSNIAHLQTKRWFQKKAEDNLKANLASYATMDQRPMPFREGATMQFHQYNIMSANVVPVAEGTPTAPITNGSVAGTVTLRQYQDTMTFSDFLLDTAYDNILEEQGVEMGYRAARTCDTLNYTQFDATSAALSASRIDLADSSTTAEYFSASVARRAAASLEAADVPNKSSGAFKGLLAGLMHPLVSFDYRNDNTAGGVLDILKFNDYGRLKAGASQNYTILTLDGIRWVSTTQVPTTANYGGGGQTAYHSYVIGQNAFLCTSLSFTDVPGEKNFRADIYRFKRGTQVNDPNGLIAAAVGYEFKYATYVLPDGIARHRRIRCEVSVT